MAGVVFNGMLVIGLEVATGCLTLGGRKQTDFQTNNGRKDLKCYVLKHQNVFSESSKVFVSSSDEFLEKIR